MGAENEARAVAERFRRDHELGLQPLGDLVALIERTTGADVAVVDSPADAHGMTAHDPLSGATFIAVASTPRPMRQRSTLAHELAHLLFQDRAADKEGRWSARDPFEIRADAFARHVLIPVPAARAFVGARPVIDEQQLSNLVQWFGVSPAIAAIALLEARLIDEATKTSWMPLTSRALAARFGWIDQYDAMSINSGRRRAPQKLAARTIRGYREGVVSIAAVARLFGTDEQSAQAMLDSGGDRSARLPIAWAPASSIPHVDPDTIGLEDALGISE